jgi:hypothetical protein
MNLHVNLQKPRKIVLLGMMTKIPVAGHVWLVAQYLIGLRRLGFDPYYVEAHGITPTVLMETPDDDGSALAAMCIEKFMRRFDMQDRWAYHALHDDGRYFGMTELALKDLYRNAELIINLHGCTVPLPEHCADYSLVGGKLVYLETDPVEMEIEVYNNQTTTIDFCLQHNIFFTWGLNYYQSDCRVPMPSQFSFLPTFPIVIADWWRSETASGDALTTVGNWEQKWHDVQFQGETYYWSKHYEYLKFIDLPQRTAQPLELALARCSDDDLKMLQANGWRVRPSGELSNDLDLYRDYLQQSRGEFTVAKDQNVRLRSGWFSERSAQYLAAGRPVITQDTGFGSALPTGRGLFSFSTMDDILAAIDTINSNYPLHCRAAEEIAHEYFNYDVVLGNLLSACGVYVPSVKQGGALHAP